MLASGRLLKFRFPLPHWEGYSLGDGEGCAGETETMRFVHIWTLMGFHCESFILFIRNMKGADWSMNF